MLLIGRPIKAMGRLEGRVCHMLDMRTLAANFFGPKPHLSEHV